MRLAVAARSCCSALERKQVLTTCTTRYRGVGYYSTTDARVRPELFFTASLLEKQESRPTSHQALLTRHAVGRRVENSRASE